jgi:hypothetical protein
MSRIVCLSRPSVKPARTKPVDPHLFGAGLFRSLPTYRSVVSTADEAWYLEQLAAAEDRHYDALAAEAEAQDRYERGCLL